MDFFNRLIQGATGGTLGNRRSVAPLIRSRFAPERTEAQTAPIPIPDDVDKTAQPVAAQRDQGELISPPDSALQTPKERLAASHPRMQDTRPAVTQQVNPASLLMPVLTEQEPPPGPRLARGVRSSTDTLAAQPSPPPTSQDVAGPLETTSEAVRLPADSSSQQSIWEAQDGRRIDDSTRRERQTVASSLDEEERFRQRVALPVVPEPARDSTHHHQPALGEESPNAPRYAPPADQHRHAEPTPSRGETARKPSRRALDQIRAETQMEPAELQSVSAAPKVEVRIGRIEVRAAPPPPIVVAPRPARPLLSLDDYLQQRRGQAR